MFKIAYLQISRASPDSVIYSLDVQNINLKKINNEGGKKQYLKQLQLKECTTQFQYSKMHLTDKDLDD